MAKCRDAQTDEICHCKTAITIRHAISPEMPKQISFDHVDLRDYRRIAGDNPSVYSFFASSRHIETEFSQLTTLCLMPLFNTPLCFVNTTAALFSHLSPPPLHLHCFLQCFLLKKTLCFDPIEMITLKYPTYHLFRCQSNVPPFLTGGPSAIGE
jgi:hypothetical protein